MTSEVDFRALIERMGEPHFRQRFVLQVEHAQEVFGRGRTLFHIENVEWLMVVLYYALKGLGVYSIGYRNYKAIRIVENELPVKNLPASFDGFRILQITDLHIDLDPTFVDTVVEKVQGIEYDVCVITGDFRESTSGEHTSAVRATGRVVEQLKPPVYAVLGNHDFLEMIPPLEAMGIQILLNETVTLERGGEVVYLSGVDDPHFYETENLQKALDGIPAEAVSILLSHSPEIYRKAAASGYQVMLCGHTHGGQICLPGRIPILRNGDIPRRMTYGNWRHNSLHGYTSAGVGACGVPVRYFCPPEMVVHVLRRDERPHSSH